MYQWIDIPNVDATTLQSLSKFPKFLVFPCSFSASICLSSQDKETGYLGTDGVDLCLCPVVSLGFPSTVMGIPRGMSRDICWPCRSSTSKAAVWVWSKPSTNTTEAGGNDVPFAEKEGLGFAAKRRSGHGFEPADEIMLNTLAEQVSVALHNAEFYRAAIITSERANAAWQVSRKRRKWPVICIHQWFGVMGVWCLLNWGLTKHDAIIDAWPRRSIIDFVGSGLRISPKKILQVQLKVLKNDQICNIPGFWKAVFSLVTFQHWTQSTFWIPSRNLPGNQGCYPRGNACPSGSVQRFPDRWEVGHVDGLMMKSIWKYLRISGYLSLDFGRADLVGKILECLGDKSRMVMEVLNSREEHTGFLSRRSRYFHSLHNKFRFRRSACYQKVTIWAFHERKNWFA